MRRKGEQYPVPAHAGHDSMVKILYFTLSGMGSQQKIVNKKLIHVRHFKHCAQ